MSKQLTLGTGFEKSAKAMRRFAGLDLGQMPPLTRCPVTCTLDADTSWRASSTEVEDRMAFHVRIQNS